MLVDADKASFGMARIACISPVFLSIRSPLNMDSSTYSSFYSSYSASISRGTTGTTGTAVNSSLSPIIRNASSLLSNSSSMNISSFTNTTLLLLSENSTMLPAAASSSSTLTTSMLPTHAASSNATVSSVSGGYSSLLNELINPNAGSSNTQSVSSASLIPIMNTSTSIFGYFKNGDVIYLHVNGMGYLKRCMGCGKSVATLPMTGSTTAPLPIMDMIITDNNKSNLGRFGQFMVEFVAFQNFNQTNQTATVRFLADTGRYLKVTLFYLHLCGRACI